MKLSNPRCRGGSRTHLKSHWGHPSSQSVRYTADHPKTLGQVVVAYKAVGVVSYARCTTLRYGLGGRFVFRWQESNLQSISLELLSAGFRSCSHTPYLKRFYQVAVSFYQLIKLHRNHKNKRCIFSEGAATLVSPLYSRSSLMPSVS